MAKIELTIEHIGVHTETKGVYTLKVHGTNGGYYWFIERQGVYGWVASNASSGSPNARMRPYKTFDGAKRAGKRRLAVLAGKVTNDER